MFQNLGSHDNRQILTQTETEWFVARQKSDVPDIGKTWLIRTAACPHVPMSHVPCGPSGERNRTSPAPFRKNSNSNSPATPSLCWTQRQLKYAELILISLIEIFLLKLFGSSQHFF